MPWGPRLVALAAGIALAAAAGVLVVARVAGGGGGPDPSRLLLPDLVQVQPYGLAGSTVRTSRGSRFRLGFASAVENHGEGPLLVVAHRPGRKTPVMVVDQAIRRGDGSVRTVPRVGRARFTRSTDHRHWHYLGFDRYEVRALDGSGLRRDRKTGFCLGDRYDTKRALPGRPPRAEWREQCARNRPQALVVEEGISPGWGDNYAASLEGQYVDITNLPSGRYELVHRVNADRRLRESSYANNASAIVFSLSWPRGFDGAPSIRVVAKCGDGRRCRPPE